MSKQINSEDKLFHQIIDILESSKRRAIQSINTTMVGTYFQIGKAIVEGEQKGKTKAQYNSQTIENLSNKLTQLLGKGFKIRNLEAMRKFYILYGKTQTVSAEFKIPNFTLSWSHYVRLMRMEEAQRRFYEIESTANSWSPYL